MKGWQGFILGITTLLFVFGGVGIVSAGLSGTSTLLGSWHAEKDATTWITCEAYSNTDATKSWVCTVPNGVAVTLSNRLDTGYSDTILDEDTGEDIPNPESRIEYILRQGLGRYLADEYHAQLVEEWEASKPEGLI